MNKRNFKNYSRKTGIPAIPEYSIDEQTGRINEKSKFPLIVKPADNGGSFGITICSKPEQVHNAIVFARNNSSSGDILIEKFLIGSYFQFEIYIQNGIKYLAYTKERVFYDSEEGCPNQPFIDIYPSENENLIKKFLFPKLSLLLSDIGVHNGSVMFQGILEDGIPYIMDVAFRLSGGMDFRVVQKDKGVNAVGNYMQYALTGEWGDDIKECEKPLSRYYATLCIGLKNGVIGEITGIDKIKSLNFVYAFYQYYNIGDAMKLSGRFLQTICRVFFFGDSKKDICDKTVRIMNLIHVTDKNQESLLLPYRISDPGLNKH